VGGAFSFNKILFFPKKKKTPCGGWGGGGGKRETEATQLAACNTSHQPRLAGAKVSLCNKWYLTDIVFNVAVKGNV